MVRLVDDIANVRTFLHVPKEEGRKVWCPKASVSRREQIGAQVLLARAQKLARYSDSA